MNPSPLAAQALDSHLDDLRRSAGERAVVSRRAAAARGARGRAPAAPYPDAADVAIRLARAADAPALARLAALDAGEPPAGRVLLAESGGRAVAALPLDGGRALADPFERTADVVRLLELRARQLRAERTRRPAGALRALLPTRRAVGRPA